MTEVKSGPAFQRAENSSLVAVMRRDGFLAEDYARRHGVPRCYDDARALIADPEVNAVYVATPPSTHCEYACMAMRAGKPVYVEKPMAMDATECEEMLAVSVETGMPVFVAYYRRALPRFLKIRELLERRVIGDVRRVRVKLSRPLDSSFLSLSQLPWRVRPEISGGGLFVDLGSHTLDILDFLFGPLREISGEAKNLSGAYAAEDWVQMSFACGDDIRGEALWDFNSDSRSDEVVLEGRRGRLVFATFSDCLVTVEVAGAVQTIKLVDPQHVQLPLIQTVVSELRGEGSCPSTGVSADRTTRVIDEVLCRYRIGNTA